MDTLSTSQGPMKERVERRMQRVAQAAKLYADARNAPKPRKAGDIYNEIAKVMNIHPLTALQFVQEGFRKRSWQGYVPRAVSPVEYQGKTYVPGITVYEYLKVGRGTFQSWVRYGDGPQPQKVFDPRLNREVLAWDMDKVKAWAAAITPKTDSRGFKHYFDRHGNPLPKKAERETIVLPSNKVIAEAFAKAAREEPKPQSKSQLKRITAQRAKIQDKVVVVNNTAFDTSVMDKDGKIRGMKNAAKFLGIPLSQLTGIFYGNIIGYNYLVRGTIKHEYENCQQGGKTLVFDPKVLMEWKSVTWRGVPHPEFKRNTSNSKYRWGKGKKKRHARRKVTKVAKAAPTLGLIPEAPKEGAPFGSKPKSAKVKFMDLPVEEKRRIWREQKLAERTRKGLLAKRTKPRIKDLLLEERRKMWREQWHKRDKEKEKANRRERMKAIKAAAKTAKASVSAWLPTPVPEPAPAAPVVDEQKLDREIIAALPQPEPQPEPQAPSASTPKRGFGSRLRYLFTGK